MVSIEEKVEICIDRMKNLSYREVAKRHNMTFQNVSLILADMKPKDTLLPHKPELGENTCRNIFSLHFKGYSKEDICSVLKLDTKEVENLYAYVTVRKSRTLESKLYPAIAKWANENDYSLQRLGAESGISPNYLGQTLAGNGNKPLTKELAMRLSNLTGLTLKEIYSELYEKGKAEE